MNQEQNTQWLKLRKTGISGTDVSAILGLNPFKTPFEVYQDKISDEIIPVEENEKMLWGKLHRGYYSK